jgi:predicted nucleic acid-binding protein
MGVLLGRARAEGGLAISPPVYAELQAHPRASLSFVEHFLTQTSIVVDFVLEEAVWREAANAFGAYAQRRRASGDGSPKRLLADFIIGSHAMLRCDRLLTLDSTRYTTSFPRLVLFS